MKLLFSIPFLFALSAFGQDLLITPSPKNENWISFAYYDTEYIFIQNDGQQSVTLNFENVELDIPSEWHVSACTSTGCFNDVPTFGSLGSLAPGEQAYISVNLSVNDTEGDGTIRFAITEQTNPKEADTISFIYHATEDGSIDAGPWIKVNYFANALTVFLRDDQIGADLKIFDLQGKLVMEESIEGLYSFPLGDEPKGTYILTIEDKIGRKEKLKLVNF